MSRKKSIFFNYISLHEDVINSEMITWRWLEILIDWDIILINKKYY